MVRLRVLVFATVLLFVSLPAMAANFAVGTCKPRLISFATISAAVAGVPPGSTIQVCPGVYPEQITISQPLTLQGIASGNQDQSVITVPSTGLTANVTSIFAEPVAAQVLVQSSVLSTSQISWWMAQAATRHAARRISGSLGFFTHLVLPAKSTGYGPAVRPMRVVASGFGPRTGTAQIDPSRFTTAASMTSMAPAFSPAVVRPRL